MRISTLSVIIVGFLMHYSGQASPGYVLTNDCAAEASVTVTNALTLGSKIEVSYELRATTNLTQYFMNHFRRDDIGVLVFDHAWKVLPTKVEYPISPSALESRFGSMTFCDISRKPWTASFDLQNYCDITEPGIYRVMVVCPVSKWKGPFVSEIASKPAEFMVLPKTSP